LDTLPIHSSPNGHLPDRAPHSSPTRRSSDLRLEQFIDELGKIGETPRGGLTRLALTDDDRRGRDWMVARMREAGHPITPAPVVVDRKSTRLNSSHVSISYAVFCLKKKNQRRV